MRVITGPVETVMVSKSELLDVAATPDQIEFARTDLERAESRGFLYCQAVFVDGKYDGLNEKAHPTNGSLAWGRGQDVTVKNFFRDGKLVRDPEWRPEPPEAAWEAFGFRCEVRQNGIGYRCGYVSIPASHPWHGIHYDGCVRAKDCPNTLARAQDPSGYFSCYEHSPGGLVDVHGGLTYAEPDGERWEFGFDCAHSGDAPSPEKQSEDLRRYGHAMSRPGDHYWTLDEVIEETNRLAEQLAGVTAG